MSSLTEELGKLFALHQAGALTAEEFQEAKTSIIKNYSSTEKAVCTEVCDEVSVNNNSESKEYCEEEQHMHSLEKVKELLYEEKLPAQKEEKEKEEIAGNTDKDEELCELLSINSSYTLQTQREIEECYPHVQVWELLSSNTFTDTMRFEIALRHLERIITNVLQNPQQNKYRRLRLQNERLEHELWSVSGTIALLQSIGFVMGTESNHKGEADCQENTSNTGNESGEEVHCVTVEQQCTEANKSEEELYLRLTNKAYDVSKLSEAISALSFIRECDRAMRHRLQTIASLQTDPLISIRLERAQELAHNATDINSVLSFFVSEFAHDDAHDLLCSSIRHLTWINKLLHYVNAEHTGKENVEVEESSSNINCDSHEATSIPSKQTVVKLLLRNERVYQCIVQQRGALELLLYFAKCQLTHIPRKNECSVQHLCKSTNDKTQCETLKNELHNDVFLIFPMIAYDTKVTSSTSQHDIESTTNTTQTVSKETIMYVINIIDKVKEEIECIRERRTKEERESAIQTMRERRQRAMLHNKHFARSQRAANHHDSTITSLPQERSVNISQQIVEKDSDDSDDENNNNTSNGDNEVNSEDNKTQKKKRRIPVAEALAILLGKQREPLEE